MVSSGVSDLTTETNFCSVEKQGGSVWQTRI